MTTPTNSELYALLRQSFPAFIAKVFATLHPGKELDLKWYIDAMCYQLERVRTGETNRLIINVPPRMLKSITVSVAWPAFLLGHNPSLKIMVVSHSTDLATVLSNQFRQVVEAEWYREAFPTMSGAPRKDNERIFETSAGGKREARSVGAGILGLGADCFILDDLLDPGEMTTQLAEEKVNSWLDQRLSTRVNDPAKTAMVLVMQRLSEGDPVAHMSAQEDWDKLVLPAIAQSDISVPMGPHETHLFRQGDLLDQERFPRRFLDTQKAKLGSASFRAQYLQAPVPDGGGMVDMALFQRYEVLPREYDARFLSVDAASGSESGSYSVIQILQITNGRLYLAKCVRGYWSFPDLRLYVINIQKKIAADFIVVEKASSGFALLDELWSFYDPMVREKLVQAWKPKPAKEVRMAQAMVLVQQGLVLIPQSADWLPDFERELAAFPGGTHDDQVDALSQGVLFFKKYLTSRYNPHFKGGGRVISG
jgi:predicted phage terminase large subunit-like protein